MGGLDRGRSQKGQAASAGGTKVLPLVFAFVFCLWFLDLFFVFVIEFELG